MKLTEAQIRELETLARNPLANVGSCTNRTMRALKKKGLVDLKWSAYSTGNMSWRGERWVVTAAGRALVGERDAARRRQRESFK